jgi:hypothetical protein
MADQNTSAWSRRKFMAGVGAGATVMSLGALPRVAAAADNPVVIENQKSGTTSWRLSNRAPDTLAQVSGYCRQHSVVAGQTAEICVGVGSTRSIRAEVYRMGWYGGTGGRQVTTRGNVTVNPSATPSLNNSTGEIICNFPVAFSFAIDSSWVSGIYMVKLIDGSGNQSYAQFVVRDNRGADLLYQQPNTTNQAYTATPTGVFGKSLYDYQSAGADTVGGGPAAVTVNFDRPYERSGAGLFLLFEVDLVQFLERHGYDVSYVTTTDIHDDPAELRRHKIIMSAGHDEYWTQGVFDGWLAARDAGVSVCCFGANSAYWRVRLENAGGTARRMVAYKFASAVDPGSPKTSRFRDAGLPEDQLWGVQYELFGTGETDLVPAAVGHWFWDGTGAVDGVALPGTACVGYEIDNRQGPLPANTENTILAASPYATSTAHMSIYRSTSGAWVWASGTISYAWALGRSGHAHAAVQRATQNLLNRMLSDAGVPDPPKPPEPEPPPVPPVPPVPAFAPFATASAFVGQQYSDFLFRQADGGGMAYWTGQLEADGSNMAEIVERFLHSAEFAPRFEVARLYQACFDRIPDTAGYDFWTSRRAQGGQPLGSIAASFISSPEFVARYGSGTSNRQFVSAMYRNVFGRAPDSLGLDYWVRRIDGGLGRASTLLAFSESLEFKAQFQANVEVIAVYQGLLDRPPTESEVVTLSNAIRRGQMTVTNVTDNVLESAEYMGRIG